MRGTQDRAGSCQCSLPPMLIRLNLAKRRRATWQQGGSIQKSWVHQSSSIRMSYSTRESYDEDGLGEGEVTGS